MTDKVVIPQISDFVHGQTLTQPGFDALNEISNRIDSLENVSNDETQKIIDNLRDDLTALEQSQPKIEFITSGESTIYPIEDGYDYYEASVLVSVPFNNSHTNILRITGLISIAIPGSADDSEPYVKSLFASAHREDLEYLSNGGFEFKYFANGTDTPTSPLRWVVKKYKQGA